MGGGLRGAVGPQWVPASALQRARSRSVRGGWGSDPIAGLGGGRVPLWPRGPRSPCTQPDPPAQGSDPRQGADPVLRGGGCEDGVGMDRIGTDRIHLQGPGPVRGGSGSHPVCIWGVWIPLRGGGGDSPARSWIPLQKLRPSRCRAGSRRRAVGSDVCVAVCDPHICFLGGCLDPCGQPDSFARGWMALQGLGPTAQRGCIPLQGRGWIPLHIWGGGRGRISSCVWGVGSHYMRVWGGWIPLYVCMRGLHPIMCMVEQDLVCCSVPCRLCVPTGRAGLPPLPRMESCGGRVAPGGVTEPCCHPYGCGGNLCE